MSLIYKVNESINECCGEYPTVWTGCDALSSKTCCGECMEKIECNVCGRVIYGYDDESIEEWNNGNSDEEIRLI